MHINIDTIKGKKLFSYVFENGRRFFDNNSLAVVCYKEINSENKTVLFSVSVPKKSAKKAIVRNRIKRLMRESIRLFFRDYMILNEDCPLSHVSFVWRNAPSHPSLICLEDVKPELYRLLKRAVEYSSDGKK